MSGGIRTVVNFGKAKALIIYKAMLVYLSEIERELKEADIYRRVSLEEERAKVLQIMEDIEDWMKKRFDIDLRRAFGLN